jgi:8-oxo-dGTP diphosphatase
MREDGTQRLEVHVAGVCFDHDKVLILKRSNSRSLYPGLWECGGGQVNCGENFQEAVIRQLREEAGIMVKPLEAFKTYEIIIKDGKIPGLRFACKFLGYANGNEPRISKEHTEWRWQHVNELDDFEFIPGLKEDIRNAYNTLKASA